MDPNNMMLAERLAQHFCQLRFVIGHKHGIKYPTWELTKRKEKQVLIETFSAILTESGKAQLDQNLQQRGGL